MSHGLPSAVAKIRSVLARFSAVTKAVLYGSRAKGNFKPSSDIDLTLIGDGLTLADLGAIAEALDELLLPYMIDLSRYNRIENPELREHIDRVGKVFYENEPGGVKV